MGNFCGKQSQTEKAKGSEFGTNLTTKGSAAPNPSDIASSMSNTKFSVNEKQVYLCHPKKCLAVTN